MSSALAIILTAAIAIPGNGPDMVSGEIEQGLDLHGQWKGTWVYEDGVCYDADTDESRSLIGFTGNMMTSLELSDIIDEGRGKCRMKWFWSEDGWCRGIYRQDGDRLTICFCDRRGPRPTSFRAAKGQHLLVLRRVKPR